MQQTAQPAAGVALQAPARPAPPACIRAAERADIGQLQLMWQDMMRDHRGYHASFALADDAVEAWRQSTLDMVHRHDSFVFLAERGGQVVGYCSGWVAYNPPIYETRALGLISELLVARAARNKGLGSALLATARGWFLARELLEFQLSTAVRNEGAQRFWRQHGGEPLLVRYRFDTVV